MRLGLLRAANSPTGLEEACSSDVSYYKRAMWQGTDGGLQKLRASILK